jgi:hypothetical protein
LREYQLEGLNWLMYCWCLNRNGILAGMYMLQCLTITIFITNTYTFNRRNGIGKDNSDYIIICDIIFWEKHTRTLLRLELYLYLNLKWSREKSLTNTNSIFQWSSHYQQSQIGYLNFKNGLPEWTLLHIREVPLHVRSFWSVFEFRSFLNFKRF